MTRPRPDRPGPAPSPPAPTDDEAGHGLRRLEGYLYWQAEQDQAAQAARNFADLLPWLTTSQRHDLEHHYTHTYLNASRERLTHLRRRRDDLRADYETRYRRLRARCILATTATALLLTTPITLLLSHALR